MITDWHSILVNSDKLAGKKCPGLGMTIMHHVSYINEVTRFYLSSRILYYCS